MTTPTQEQIGQPTNWPDPSPEMLNTPEFERVWQKIKTWDIAVPYAYNGYCGANGNHVRAILDALYDILHRPLTAAAEVGDNLVKQLQEKVRRLTKLLDDQFGTPCEQIRHKQEIETTIERCKQVVEKIGARYHQGRDVCAALDQLKIDPTAALVETDEHG